MTRVVAVGAVSGLGVGPAAYELGAPGEPAPTALAADEALRRAGLSRARAARAPLSDRFADRATTLLAAALSQASASLDERVPSWRGARLGLCIGTSSGGMIGAERFFAARIAGAVDADGAREATYFAPLDEAWDALELPTPVRRSQIVAACASSTIAIGMGMRWLELGVCDLVLAGGYDGVGTFVAAGFESLRATSASWPSPFCLGRDGMLLGEGAGVVALSHEASLPAHFFVTGFGASADAVHITAPDREGGGLRRAAAAALAEARCEPARVDLVSAHGTATPYNDAAEAKAIGALLPGRDPIVHPFKAQIGHTLGAAGVLELLAAAGALEKGIGPATAGLGEPDPEAPARLLTRNEPADLDAVLKLSAAFGGVTAALVAEQRPAPSRRRERRSVRVAGHARVDDHDRGQLSEATGIARDRLARIDDLGLLALAAMVSLVDRVGREALVGAGVVAGYALATLDTNARFYQRLHDKGPRWVDPRQFPATSPSSGAGHISIAYGLVGPCFAVGRGLDGPWEALLAAEELVAAADVDRMVVVAADDEGSASRAWYEAAGEPGRHGRGAVALLLEAGDEPPVVEPGAAAPAGAAGHRILTEWIDRLVPR